MAEDQRRVTRASGALGGGREERREERLLDEVRRMLRHEVVEAIRGEVAHAIERKLAEGWERMERTLAQQAEEARKQAEEARKQAEEARKRAEEERNWRLDVVRRLEALEQAFRVGAAFHRTEEDRAKAVERGTKRARVEEGLAQSQHAPQAEEESMNQHRQKAPKPASTTPLPTYADVASRPTATSSSGTPVFTLVGKNGRPRKEHNAGEPENYALKPITRGNSEDTRKVIFTRDGCKDNAQDILSEVNRALKKAGVPDHIRLDKLRLNEKGVLTGLVRDRTNAQQFLHYNDIILLAARRVDSGVIAVESNETWMRLKIHGVPLLRYMKQEDPAEGLRLLREEIEAENPGVTIPIAGWLTAPRLVKARWSRNEISSSSVVLAVKERSAADRLRTTGLKAAGVHYKVERYIPGGPDAICSRCCQWGHIEEKCKHPTPRCMWCAGNHRSSDHRCLETTCSAKPGGRCSHLTEKCCNCGGQHNARSKHCPQKAEAIRRAKAIRSGGHSVERNPATVTSESVPAVEPMQTEAQPEREQTEPDQQEETDTDSSLSDVEEYHDTEH
jgi:hypothetical protein